MDAIILELGHTVGSQALLSLLGQGQFLLAFLFLFQSFETNHLAASLQFPDRLLQPKVQQAHFQNVVDARAQLGQIERFADEILGAGLESPQFVRRLGGDHQDRKIAALFDFLQPFHHLESVHAGHLEVEQDEGIAVLPVPFADLVRIGRRVDAGVPGDPQHALQQTHVGRLIVHHQNPGA